MTPFAHLHVHSHYSLLRALPKIRDLVAAAKREGCETLALTDFGNLYGAIEFYKECKAHGIKPIIGIDAHVGNGQRLVLLAENNIGYKQLLSLISKASLAEHDDLPVFSRDLLRLHANGLVALAPVLHGEISSALRTRDITRADRILSEYRDIFGNEQVFLAAGEYEDEDMLQAITEFALEKNVPLVATQEAFYLNRDDHRAWITMQAIERKAQGYENNDLDLSFRSNADMHRIFSEMPEALENTRKIAERCNVEMKLGTWVFPDFPIPRDSTFDAELRKLIEQGLVRRKLDHETQVRDRIEYEYTIISKKGYSPYFLVVADLLAYARQHGILTTIRGSVAGSMVTYVIGITNVNPLEYKLPFERFLNPERPSAPDIDMDYADNRRDEMIEYVRNKYGNDHVAQIGTFGTMLARGVVRDVARALGYPYGLGDRIAKEIPIGSQGFPMTLDRALQMNTALATIYKTEPEAQEIINLGKKIEGCARHISVHAAGVVIAPTLLTDFTPVQRDPKGGKIITQFDMHSIEDAGLLKFDFLGIRNLAILAHSVRLVEKIRDIKIDIENIAIDDMATFAMLARGETEGTFQLNGAGMTRYLKELRPTTIHDINAMVALFRPGPMETIPQYIERKHNAALVRYLDPRMEEYLDTSYGLLVYQDDVLLTAIKLAGYSWLEADMLRKAMGKKIPKVMQAEKEKLIKGFIEYGKLSKPLAEKLWKLIEPFAAYGFNKAHAASYGKVAYQTAYMKANYPVEYMASVLTAEAGDIDTIAVMVNECKRKSIPILPPDVNESFGDFTVILKTKDESSDAIRFGLYSIKNFGHGVADSIIEERKTNGAFKSLSDFLTRLKDQNLNKKALESLIQCGALDSLGERAQMLSGIELLLEYRRDASREQSQSSLFSQEATQELRLKTISPASIEQRLTWEKELLGLYVSGHPIDQFKDKLSKRSMTLKELKQKTPPGVLTVATGMIQDVRMILTRSGDQMAFVKLTDLDDELEAVIFPKNFTTYRDILRPQMYIALKGRLSNRNGELSMVTEDLRAM